MPSIRRVSLLALLALAGPCAGRSSAQAAPAGSTAPVSPSRLSQEMHRADRFLLEGRFADALPALELVTREQPRHAGAWLLLSKALAGAGRTADAVDAARHAVTLLESEPADRRAGWMPGAFYLQLGRSCAVAGDLACAETALRRADREEQASAPILRELGIVLFRLSKDEEAASVLRRSLEIDPQAPGAHVELGNALLRLGDAAGAEAEFRAAAELAPDAPEPWFGLASAASARGDEPAHEAALAQFEQRSRRRDELQEASRKLDESLRAAGEHLAAGRVAEAVAGYDAALESPLLAEGPRRALVLVELGRSRLRAGDVAGAAEALRGALSAAPSLPSASLEMGKLLAGRGLIDEAFPHLLRATELDPLQAPAHASLSMAWAALGRLDEALAEAAKASLLEPDDLELRQQYVDLLAASGREPEARALAERGGIRPPGEAAPEPAASQPAAAATAPDEP